MSVPRADPVSVSRAYVVGLPKAELHLHLEGSVGPATARRLAAKNGVPVPDYPPDGAGFSDFDAFLRCYIAITRCFSDATDYGLAVRALAESLARQGVRWAEVTFTPMTHITGGVPRDVVLEGLTAGRQAAAELGVEVRWVFDVVRTLPQWAEGTLDAAAAMQTLDPGAMVGFGVGGPEREHDDPRALADAFAEAKRMGLHAVPHAGEQAGPKSIWGALEILGAERIGHGVRCVEDPTLLAHLARERIPLEVCPTSNVRLGVVPSLPQHMLPHLLEAGLAVSIGSDDPPLFGTDVADELVSIAVAFGWDNEQVRALCRASIEHAFMPEPTRRTLLAELDAIGAGPVDVR